MHDDGERIATYFYKMAIIRNCKPKVSHLMPIADKIKSKLSCLESLSTIHCRHDAISENCYPWYANLYAFFDLACVFYIGSFLNKALLTPKRSKQENSCSISEVEEAKAILRLVPIWATSLVYGIVFAQVFTFFTKQGKSMERTIFPGFDIPPASLQTINSLAVVLFSPVYDRIFVPIARAITGKPSGITMLQRIGTGIFISIFIVVFAAFIEIKRLNIAQEYGLVEDPNATVPMSIWWLIPQYFLFGVSEIFTMVGLQEFFYDQVPNELRSMGLALYLSIVGVGSFLSGFLISIIENLSSKNGDESWFCDNINKAHLDYFYWLLSGLSVVGFTFFIYFSKSYVYNNKGIIKIVNR